MQEDLPSSDNGSVLIVMGVCGVGKSLIAERLADALGCGLVEADDFHSPQNKRKMAAGEALSDGDRLPWLDAVALAARLQVYCTGSSVVACSSLKRTYRDRLRSSLQSCRFLHLAGPRALIKERLCNRQGHFVGETLLDSQLATLEPLNTDEDGFTLEISSPVDRIVDSALKELRQAPPPHQTIAS
ncbi:MAG: gluconokinase [Roseibium sp.]|uniref:gluconokinase n=1 Tax=Roseibium sp. TaxID=1936156 RepID=UPI00262941D4|nr:gluconokinase [Roseibium sp.]MCV0428874.1 gluconokinase [Roseibium sp.]